MSGFFVSNSFGTFNSETATQKFNASLVDIPGGVTSATFMQIATGWPSISEAGGYSHSWAKDGYNGLRIWIDDSELSLYDGDEGEAFPWTNKDTIVVRDDDGAGLFYRPHNKVIAKLHIRVYGQSKSNNNGDNYLKNHVKTGKTGNQVGTGGTTSVYQGAERDNVPCLKNYSTFTDSQGYKGAEFDVWLDGSAGNYISVDMDQDISEVAQFKLVTTCGTFNAGGDDPDDRGIGIVAVKLVELKWNIPGCMDDEAINTNEDATVPDESCSYLRAVPTLTLDQSEIREGEPVNITWVLDNSGSKGYTQVEIWDSIGGVDTKVKTSTSKGTTWAYTPTSVGNHTIKIKTIWNHGTVEQDSVPLSVVDAVTFIPCDPADTHRNVDSNGECAGCKAGYSMIDATTGFCTNCEATNDDPYRSMNTDGTCGDCMDGYLEDTDSICQKVGCMTYADGTSAEDDYNYDPDAVVNDSSLCEGPGDPDLVPETIDCGVSDWSEWSAWSDATTSSGTRTRTRTIVTAQSGGGAGCPSLEETQTGVVDPTTGEVSITTQGGDVTPIEPETKSLAGPLIIGGIVLTIGLLVFRR